MDLFTVNSWEQWHGISLKNGTKIAKTTHPSDALFYLSHETD
jgi:hypothetical protein